MSLSALGSPSSRTSHLTGPKTKDTLEEKLAEFNKNTFIGDTPIGRGLQILANKLKPGSTVADIAGGRGMATASLLMKIDLKCIVYDRDDFKDWVDVIPQFLDNQSEKRPDVLPSFVQASVQDLISQEILPKKIDAVILRNILVFLPTNIQADLFKKISKNLAPEGLVFIEGFSKQDSLYKPLSPEDQGQKKDRYLCSDRIGEIMNLLGSGITQLASYEHEGTRYDGGGCHLYSCVLKKNQ